MRELRFHLLGLVLGTESLRCGAALACGMAPTPYYVVEQRAPTGATAPRNAPIVVQLKEDPNGPAVDTFAPILTLTKAGSDVPVELRSLGGRPTLVWVPTASLEPDTAYEAHFNPGYEGIPDTTWTFTTGAESTPPLSLEGGLKVTFEPGTDTILECPSDRALGCGDSGSGCTSRTLAVTKARVVIPRPHDGFPQRFGRLRLTDDMPYDFSLPSKTLPPPYQGHNVSVEEYADLENPDLIEVLITVPQQAVAYQPCFAFAATDARGDQATSEPLCLEAIMPVSNEGGAGPTLDPDEGLANEMQKPTSTSSKGCSFDRNPSSGSVWVIGLGLFALVRKRWRHGHA